MRRTLIRRLARNGGIVAALISAAVAVGAAGYHWFDKLPWLDAVLNAAMILTGMGPVNPISTPEAKVFATHHFLSRFHLELDDEE
jgi:hypothetical protein